jgi:hypothetical protein
MSQRADRDQGKADECTEAAVEKFESIRRNHCFGWFSVGIASICVIFMDYSSPLMAQISKYLIPGCELRE